MELSEYKNIFDNEKTHFFYVSTHDLVISLIRKWLPAKKLNILDAGCGTGGLAEKLKRLGSVRGIDFSGEAIKFAKERGIQVRWASIEKIPFPNNYFDIVTSIDVLYHLKVKNDIRALGEIRRVLKPKGILILRVPANEFLMSAHDRHVHTARRYNREELLTKCRRAGLVVKQISYVHSPIFPISLLKIIIEKITNQENSSSIGRINPLVNKVLTKVLSLEAWLIMLGMSLPFGQGLIVVASKN